MDYHFNKFELESYNDYPQAAVNNAKRALDWAKENGWGSCGTDVGKRRANQLANRERLTAETIARMASFARHQQNKDVPYSEGCGGLMWDAWGGSAGVEWAQRKLRQIDKQKLSMEFDEIELSEEVKPKRTIITKMKEQKFELDVINKFGRIGRELPNDEEIIYEEELLEFSEDLLLEAENNLLEVTFANEKINGLFVYYKYAVKKEVGPKVIPGTRDFCKTMINRNKVYTKDEIVNLGLNDLGTDLWKYRGGFWNQGDGNISVSCRHVWKRILTRKKI
jgi:hypothetical protein